MAAEELDDARRFAERLDAVVEAVDVQSVEEPHLPVADHGVRGALHELGLRRLPAEPGLELVDDTHRGGRLA